MNKSKLITIVALLLASFCLNAQITENQKNHYNIILILADDLGYGDLGYTGSKDIRTPHIDKLAEGGVVCTNAYASHSFCAPTRAGLMTGRYQHRFGFQNNPGPKQPTLGLPEEEIILPKLLHKAGYKSALVGKWHLGVGEKQHPLHKGFDEFYGFTGGGHDFFTCDTSDKSKHSYKTLLENNGKREEIKSYLTDDLTNYGLDFIERHREAPFFLFMSYNAPHTPLQASQEYLNRFKHIKDKNRRTYAAMISALDDGVGQIMNKLEALNLEEETLIFFMSDNGGAPFNWPSNQPFNGSKGTILEGGIHVPYVVYWKGKLQPGTYDNLVMSFDVYASATALAGVENPSDRQIDAQNLIPFLSGENKGLPHEYLYWTQGDYQEAARTGNYKYIQIEGVEKYLFNLDDDITESEDKSKTQRKQLKTMERAFKQWKKKLPESDCKNDGIANEMQKNFIVNLKNTRN